MIIRTQYGSCKLYFYKDRKWVQLQDFKIHKRHQGKGYGNILMREVLQACDDNYVHCETQNPIMEKILIRHGFKKIGTMDGGGYDLQLYEKVV